MIDFAPSGPIAQDEAEIAFHSEPPGANFQCSLNGAAWQPCTSPAHYDSLAEDAHEFQVRASGPEGVDPTPATAKWSVDTVAPAAVTDLAIALVDGDSLRLSWANPEGPDYAGALIRRAAGPTPPSSPSAGTQIAEVLPAASGYEDTTTAPGQTYSYSVFTRDDAGNYGPATTQTKAVPACSISWTGGAGTLDWGAAANWTGERLPEPGDVVCITGSAKDPPVEHSAGATSVARLIATRPLDVSGGELHLTSTIAASKTTGALVTEGRLEVEGFLISASLTLSGTLGGSGTVTVPTGGALELGTHARIATGTLVNNGTGTVPAYAYPRIERGSRFENNGSLSFEMGSLLEGECGEEAPPPGDPCRALRQHRLDHH